MEAIELLTQVLDSASATLQLPPVPSAGSLTASSPSPPLTLTLAASGLANLRYQRAECAFRLDEYNAALSDCDRALRVKPLLIAAASLRVKCLLGLRRYTEAEAELAKLNKRDDRDSTCHFKPLQQLWERIQLERNG